MTTLIIFIASFYELSWYSFVNGMLGGFLS